MAEAAGPNTVSRRQGKSEGAFRTISEVATDLDLPQHVLRFWESKFIQIRPLKRGGGRRYYRPEDVVLLRRIRRLLYEDGYTIRGVQKLLKQNGGKLLDGDGAEAAPSAFLPTVVAPGAPALAVAVVAEKGGVDPQWRRAELKALLNELEILRDRLRTVLK
jgi:DNA-binding transcriptional MerR regulator